MFNFLVHHDPSAYSIWVQRHRAWLVEPGTSEWDDRLKIGAFQAVGVECALWPHFSPGCDVV